MLARQLDIMPQNDLLPSTIAMGYKAENGTGHETYYTDFSNNMPLELLFPKDWIRNKNQMIILRNMPNSPTIASYNHYFNLDMWEFMHCFVAYLQDLERYGGAIIFHEPVKPKMIANNILDLIDHKY